jgi:hypothetical protein
MKKKSRREEVMKRRTFACGGFDNESVCRGVIACQRCGNCLVHCACAREAHVEPGAQTLAGAQLALCEEPRFTWHRG